MTCQATSSRDESWASLSFPAWQLRPAARRADRPAAGAVTATPQAGPAHADAVAVAVHGQDTAAETAVAVTHDAPPAAISAARRRSRDVGCGGTKAVAWIGSAIYPRATRPALRLIRTRRS